MRLHYRNFVLLLAACLLAACAQMGMPTPKTFNERLAAGYASVTTARSMTTTLVTAGQISAADAQNVQAQADHARSALDIARAVSGTNPLAAEDKLTATLTVLTALQAYLATRSQP